MFAIKADVKDPSAEIFARRSSCVASFEIGRTHATYP
jgi:hypothetical protein